MAPKQLIMLVVVAAAALLLPAVAFAADHLVGGDQGWSIGVDYNKWADGNEFIVGDTLVFNYTKGIHTVVEVAGAADLYKCDERNSLALWSSGEDRVALDKAGQRWFFCGVSVHCIQGMRLNFTVLPVVKFSPSLSSAPPRPSSSVAVRAAAAAVAGGAVVAAALAFYPPTTDPHGHSNSNPLETPLLSAETLTLAAALPARPAARRHVEPQGLQDAPAHQLPHARDDPGRPPAGGQVHGLRPPHEPRPRRLRGVPQAPALQVLQDHRRARGAEDARPPPPPWRGGRLHDRRGPAPARRVPRQGRRCRWRSRGPGRWPRYRPRGRHGPAAPGPARPLWPGPGRGWAGPRHDAAADLAAAGAEPLGAADGVPAGRAPAAGADAHAKHAPWGPAADADAVPAPAGDAACPVPWGSAAAVHEGTTADGAATSKAWDAGATATGDEARDATAAIWTTQAWDAATAAWSTAAWTEPTAVTSYWLRFLLSHLWKDSWIPPLLHHSVSYWGYQCFPCGNRVEKRKALSV